MQHPHSWKHSLFLLAVLAAPSALNQMFKESHHSHAYRSIAADDTASSTDTSSTLSSADTQSTVQVASADTQATAQASDTVSTTAALDADTSATTALAVVPAPALAPKEQKVQPEEVNHSHESQHHKDKNESNREHARSNCLVLRPNTDLTRLQDQNTQMLQIMNSMVQLVTTMVQNQSQQRIWGSYFDSPFSGFNNSPQMPSWSNVFPNMWGWNTGFNQNFSQGFNPNFSQGFPSVAGLSGQQSSPFAQPSSVVNNYYYGSGQAQMGLNGQSPLISAAQNQQALYAPLMPGQNSFNFSGAVDSTTPQFGNFRGIGSI